MKQYLKKIHINLSLIVSAFLFLSCAHHETMEAQKLRIETNIAERLQQRVFTPPLDEPLKVHKIVSPHFSDSAIREFFRNKSDGSVVVQFKIGENGEVSDVKIVGEAHHHLAAHVVLAVMQWKFNPPIRNGKPTVLYLQYQFVFAVAK